MQIKDFKSVVTQYKVIFFDAYGVLKTYNGVIPGMDDTFRFLKSQDIEFFVLTNDASRSPERLAEKFWKIGLEAITEEKIISSGMLAREYLLNKVDGGTVAFLGTQESAHYIETAGLKTISIRDLDIHDTERISALVLLDDEGFDWNHDINKAINLVRKRNIPVVVANTDHAYPVSPEHVSIAVGGLADLIEGVVKKTFIRFGKPDSQMFNFAYEHMLQTRKVEKAEILMVGDTLETDILGGNKFGIDTALVLTGNTLPEWAGMLIQSSGIVPNFVCRSAGIHP